MLKLLLWERGDTSALALEVEGVEVSRKVGSELRAGGTLTLSQMAFLSKSIRAFSRATSSRFLAESSFSMSAASFADRREACRSSRCASL